MSKISLVTHEEVQNHIANNSPSKVSFRFSKAKRFKDNNPECPIAFYTFKSELSKRHSSIGSSKKVDFLIDFQHSPPSNQYNPDTYFHHVKSKGLTFGLSRESSPDRSYLIPQIHKNPSPSQVILTLSSTKLKNQWKIHLHIRLGPKQLTPYNATCPIRNHQALVHTKRSNFPHQNLTSRWASSRTQKWE